MHLLDVAGGTGDIATRFLRAARRRRPGHAWPTSTPRCSRVGRDRALDRRLARRDRLAGRRRHGAAVRRTVASTPVTIAFGIRNVTRIDRALARGAARAAARRAVPVPGVLQGRPAACWRGSTTPIRSTWSRCSGGWVAGDEASYRYLVESIRRFPDQPAFAALMREAGLRAGPLAQPLGRHRGDPFRLAAVSPEPRGISGWRRRARA